jgi:hypothetical protein
MTGNTYTVYKLDANGEFSNKEQIGNIHKLEAWLGKAYGQWARVLIIKDKADSFERLAVDNGKHWEIGPRRVMTIKWG